MTENNNKHYQFNWETFDIIISGKSSIDAQKYLSGFPEKANAERFLAGYGFDISDPIQSAELFGNFQEAIQFIKRYFLKEGNEEGLDTSVPNIFYSITDVSNLLMIATQKADDDAKKEEAIWAGIILKVMHTILHTDKDLRYRYFTTIQTQIFDRFYRVDDSRNSAGNGLGLAIAKELVEKDGGMIEVESSEEGTMFTLDYPLN